MQREKIVEGLVFQQHFRGSDATMLLTDRHFNLPLLTPRKVVNPSITFDE